MNTGDSQRARGEGTSAGRKRELQGMFLVFMGATFWGFSATCVKFLVGNYDIGVPWLADTRLFAAGFLFLIVAFVRDRDKFAVLFSDKKLIVTIVVYAIVAVVMMQIGYMYSIQYTNPGTALLLLEVSVPLVLVFECVRDRRRPTKMETVAIAFAIAGVLSISTQGNIGSLGISLPGLLFGLMSAVANTGYILLSASLVKKCGPLVTNALGMLIAAVMLAPMGRPWDVPVGMDAVSWLVFAAIILVGTMAAYASFSAGVVWAGSVNASLLGVFEPVSGAVISALWLGTVFSGWDLLGGALIVTMMIMVALKR